MKIFRFFWTIALLELILVETSVANPSELPRISFSNISESFVGAFKVDHSDGISKIAYSLGRLGYDSSRNTIFVDSHIYDLSIAEFAVPDALGTSDVASMPSAQLSQSFHKVLSNVPSGNPDRLDGIGALSRIGNNLFVQMYRAYDASGTVEDTTMIISNPADLAGSPKKGFFEMNGGARTISYISEIPAEWRSKLGGSYLAGNGGGISINGRLSSGPSLFSFNPESFGDSPGTAETKEWLNYPHTSSLSVGVISPVNPNTDYRDWDAFNSSGENELWTESGGVWIGFIVPGSRTFAAIGHMGMIRSGGGYKIVQSSGRTCPGPCPYDNTDWNTYYWLFDLNDITNATDPWKPLPYEYGVFDDRFIQYNSEDPTGLVTGGSFDPTSGQLFVLFSHAGGDHESDPHVVGVYQISNASGTNQGSSIPNPPILNGGR